MKKKNNKTLIVILSVLAGVFLIATQTDIMTFSSVPIDSGTSSSPYICPSGEGISCNIKGVMKCEQQTTSTAVVRARTTTSLNSIGARMWYAIDRDYNDGIGMESWCPTTSLSASLSLPSPSQLPYGEIGYFLFDASTGACNDAYCLYVPKQAGSYYRYSQTSGCSADLSPTIKYNCQNQEYCSGTSSSYSCTGLLKVEQSQTNSAVLVSEPLSYNSNNAGQDTSNQYNVPSGSVTKVTGGSSNSVLFEVVESFDECVKDVCTSDKKGIIKCVNGRPSETITFCQSDNGESCVDSFNGAYCQSAFSLTSVVFRDSADTRDVDAYLPDEAINLKFKISSPTITTSKTAEITIFRDQTPIQTKSVSFIPSQTKSITFNAVEEVGTYYAVIKVAHESAILIFGEGRDIDFRITSIPLEANFDVFTNLIDFDTGGSFTSRSKFYTSHPISVEFRVYRTGDSDDLQFFDSANMVAKLNGNQITLPVPQTSKGTLKYNLALSNPGTLRFVGTATKGGLSTPEVSVEVSVEQPSVNVKFLNDDNLANIQPGTTATINFETRSAIGNLVDSTNTLRVIKPDGTSPTLTNIITGSGGSYSFTYLFQERGGYQFFVQSSASNHVTSIDTPSTFISVDEGNPGELECVENSECSQGYECRQNQCVPVQKDITIIVYIIGGILILSVMIIVVLVIRRKRQPIFGY